MTKHKKFYDEKNFPNGFAKSGEFTIVEARLLEEHGIALRHIAQKNKSDSNTLQIEKLLEYTESTVGAKEKIEKIWKKYEMITTSRPKTIFSGCGGGLGLDEDGNEVAFSTIIPKGHLTKRFK